jgi:hypothetical protein
MYLDLSLNQGVTADLVDRKIKRIHKKESSICIFSIFSVHRTSALRAALLVLRQADLDQAQHVGAHTERPSIGQCPWLRGCVRRRRHNWRWRVWVRSLQPCAAAAKEPLVMVMVMDCAFKQSGDLYGVWSSNKIAHHFLTSHYFCLILWNRIS